MTKIDPNPCTTQEALDKISKSVWSYNKRHLTIRYNNASLQQQVQTQGTGSWESVATFDIKIGDILSIVRVMYMYITINTAGTYTDVDVRVTINGKNAYRKLGQELPLGDYCSDCAVVETDTNGEIEIIVYVRSSQQITIEFIAVDVYAMQLDTES